MGAMPTRMAVSVFVLVALISGCSPSAPADSRSRQTPATGQTIAVGQNAGTLIPKPDAPLDVTFVERGPTRYDGGSMFFFWRQSGGTRRFDEIDIALPTSGSFTVVRHFPDDPLLQNDAIGCLWRDGDSGDKALAVCHAGGDSNAEELIDRVLTGTITEVLPSRTIAGSDASCFQASSIRQSAEFCISTRDGVPLYFSGSVSGEDYSIEAHMVERTSNDLSAPELPLDESATTQLTEVARDSLHLPAYPTN